MAQNHNPFAVQGMNVVTPKGKALWCKYLEPDRKYVPEGKLETQIVLDPNDPATQAFVDRMEALQDTAFNETVETLGAKGKNVVKAPIYQEDDNGNYVFKFHLNKVDLRKAAGKQHTIQAVDANKQPITDGTLVGNGSTIRVASFVYPYYMASTRQVGLTTLWSKLQVIDLVEYSGGGVGDDFDEEDGYVAPTASNDADDF